MHELSRNMGNWELACLRLFPGEAGNSSVLRVVPAWSAPSVNPALCVSMFSFANVPREGAGLEGALRGLGLANMRSSPDSFTNTACALGGGPAPSVSGSQSSKTNDGDSISSPVSYGSGS